MFQFWKKEIQKYIQKIKQKQRKEKCDKVLNTISYQVNMTKKFKNCPIEQDHCEGRKRKV